MVKTISAYINVALVDYDDSTKDHVVELMKESLREQTSETILENTWNIEEKKRKLFKNEEGVWVTNPSASLFSEDLNAREILEVMTIEITVDVVNTI